MKKFPYPLDNYCHETIKRVKRGLILELVLNFCMNLVYPSMFWLTPTSFQGEIKSAQPVGVICYKSKSKQRHTAASAPLISGCLESQFESAKENSRTITSHSPEFYLNGILLFLFLSPSRLLDGNVTEVWAHYMKQKKWVQKFQSGYSLYYQRIPKIPTLGQFSSYLWLWSKYTKIGDILELKTSECIKTYWNLRLS